MPGVTVLPPPPTPFPKLPKMQNGSTTHSRRESVSDIKSAAKEQVQRASKGASPTSLLEIAKQQSLMASAKEGEGDIKGAYAALIKATTLMAMFMDSTEFKQDKAKRGVLTLGWQSFQQGEGRDLANRMHNLEAKLMEIDSSASASRSQEDDALVGSPRKPGGIADRVKQLQSAGLSVAPSKRISRELSSLNSIVPVSSNTPPMSPDVPSPHPNRTSLPSVIPPPSATPAFTPTVLPSATNTATTNASTSTSTTATPLNPFSQPHQPPVLSSLSSPPTAANSANPSPHTLIPASSFGPPSPTSSTSSSPRLNHFDFTGFQQAFPSIDELDEMAGLVIPSNPTGGTGTSSAGGSRRSSNSKHSGSSSSLQNQNYNHNLAGLKDDAGGGGVLAGFPPIHAPKAFPALPLDPGPRPSSTPIPPTIDTFVSRPASPSVVGRSPMSPTVPRKPSGLGLNSSMASATTTTTNNITTTATTMTTGVPLPLPNPIPIPIHASASVSSSSNAYQPTNRSPLISGSGTLTPTGGSPEKRELPFTTLFPRTLLECMQKGSGYKVLLLDVRTREEFRRERLNVDTVVCIEPSVLLRERVTDETISNSLSVAPKQESLLFSNRDKFDLVAICDESSNSTQDSPAIANLMKAIYELSFKTILRNMPMILVGGLSAWKRDLGEIELVREGVVVGGGAGTGVAISLGLGAEGAGYYAPSPKLNGGLGINGSPAMNGIPPSAGYINGTTTPSSSSSASASTSQPAARTNGPALGLGGITNGHSRTPAESSTSSALFSPGLAESYVRGTASARPGGSFGVAGSSGVLDGAVGAGVGGVSSPPPTTYQQWIPPAGALASMDNLPLTSPRIGGDVSAPLSPPAVDLAKRPLVRKPAISRPVSSSVSENNATASHRSSPSLASAGFTTISYPQFSQYPTSSSSSSAPTSPPSFANHSQTPKISPQVTGSSFSHSPRSNNLVSLPPQAAAINPSPLARRRSDYIDQSQEALSGSGMLVNGAGMVNGARGGIDYPTLSSQHILRPPPAAVQSGMERLDNRPRILQSQVPSLPPKPGSAGAGVGVGSGLGGGASGLAMVSGVVGPRPPTIQSDYPVTYWGDIQIGMSGLRNLGNTCYMNSTIQCLSATVPFAMFFRGTEQHDSQEFLSFLLDGLHEDLNRVLNKPPPDNDPNREAELERLPVQIASEKEWQIYRMRNDSLVVDFFQGQFKNTLQCLTCHKTSTTYNSFMYLTLPIPTSRSSSKVTLHQCLDAFVKEEVMEKSDAWNCPSCKTLRKATKRLSLSRLPPVLLIHLKRFSVKGHFTDKVETMVDFPLKSLDLTNYMPPPLPPGIDRPQTFSLDDPRSQTPPYRYDLYGVTNHFGTLSSGHYTAFISSRGGWYYCDDSRIAPADPKDVVVRKPVSVLSLFGGY